MITCCILITAVKLKELDTVAKLPQTSEAVEPKYRFPIYSDQNKYGRMLALLLTQYSSKDKRGSATVRFDVYPMQTERQGNRTHSVFVSRIYVQRDVDTDNELPGRPYLLVEETVDPDHRLQFLDVASIEVTKVEYDPKGRPTRAMPQRILFADLPEVAHDAYEFLVGMY
jgi:hypothetical protein